MTFFELFLIGIGLSMDAFAVSICKGLSMQKIDKKYTLCIGLFFGGFQALMPLTGYLLGSQFSGYIERFDHWIAFVLLALIGFNMIKESREEEEEEEKPYAGVNFKELLILAVATSIDALAVGVTFAFLQVNIVPAITITVRPLRRMLSRAARWASRDSSTPVTRQPSFTAHSSSPSVPQPEPRSSTRAFLGSRTKWDSTMESVLNGKAPSGRFRVIPLGNCSMNASE